MRVCNGVRDNRRIGVRVEPGRKTVPVRAVNTPEDLTPTSIAGTKEGLSPMLDDTPDSPHAAAVARLELERLGGMPRWNIHPTPTAAPAPDDSLPVVAARRRVLARDYSYHGYGSEVAS